MVVPGPGRIIDFRKQVSVVGSNRVDGRVWLSSEVCSSRNGRRGNIFAVGTSFVAVVKAVSNAANRVQVRIVDTFLTIANFFI